MAGFGISKKRMVLAFQYDYAKLLITSLLLIKSLPYKLLDRFDITPQRCVPKDGKLRGQSHKLHLCGWQEHKGQAFQYIVRPVVGMTGEALRRHRNQLPSIPYLTPLDEL